MGSRPYLRAAAVLVMLLVLASQPPIASAELASGTSILVLDIARTTSSMDRVSLSGDVPIDEFPDIQPKADWIWTHIADLLQIGESDPPPAIHFYPFDKQAQPRGWAAWQKEWTRSHPVIWHDWMALKEHGPTTDVSREWIDSNIDRILPFPRSFLAFHYAGTNRIQMNPSRTFRASIQPDQNGWPYDVDGRGYYSMAHEMLHYALELKGVLPAKLHHCLMLQSSPDQESPGLMEQVASHLVESGIIAAGAKLRGLRTEQMFSPCAGLTTEEQLQVRNYGERLQHNPRAE